MPDNARVYRFPERSRLRVVGIGSPGEITLARSFLWGKSFGFKVAMNAARACRLCDRCHARRHGCNPRVSIL